MVPVIGWAGTAKNTGKTTALLAFLDEVYRFGLTPGLTSIGLDGETKDQVTGLAKPRFWLETGTWIATAEQSLQASSAGVEHLQRTGIPTALGEVVIARIERPGYLILAGPSRAEDLQAISRKLAEQGVEVILADGALGRITPFAAVDGWVLSTGAARSVDPAVLAQEMAAVQAITSLPVGDRPFPSTDKISINGETFLTVGSLLDDLAALELIQRLPQRPSLIAIPGAVHGPLLQRVIDQGALRDGSFPHTLWFSSPFHLLAGGQAPEVAKALQQLELAGGKAAVGRQVPLLAVTVNPFYPAYRQDSRRYEADSLEGGSLRRAIEKAVSAPVFDILQSGATPLWHCYQNRFCT